MIVSASRRTDIPAFYSEWFFRRIREGFVYVRNPMNPRQVSRISLSPETVDGIVFWTKNPAPMLPHLDRLRDYPYYFQVTITPYGMDVEQNVPNKNQLVIPAFQRLSREAGKERVVWRYDPILLNGKYTMEYHIKYFRKMAERLADYTETCTVSFLDMYQKIQRRITPLQITAPSEQQMLDLMGAFYSIAKEHGLVLDTCAEEIDLGTLGIGHASCIDRARLERIGGYKLDLPKDKNQRRACGCAESVDIGAYNTCQNGCLYCYANVSSALVSGRCGKYDPSSPLLCDTLTEADIIKTRETKSNRSTQVDLFG